MKDRLAIGSYGSGRGSCPARLGARRRLFAAALAGAAGLLAGCPSPFSAAELSMLKDKAAPGVSFTSPGAGSVFESSVSVAGVIVDYDEDGAPRSGDASRYIASASYHVYGDEAAATPLALSGSGGFSFALATAGYDGQITIIVTALDKNGNEGSGSITLAPDGEGPFLAITSPSDYGEYATAITLSGYARNSATDSSTSEVSAEVSYKIPGTALTGNLALDAEGAFSAVLDVSAFSANLAIEVTAADLNGNETTAIVTIVKPSDGGDVSGFSVVSGNKGAVISWDDVYGAESYTLRETWNLLTQEGVASPYTWTGLSNGQLYNFQLTAELPDGKGEDAVSASVDVIPLSTRTLAPRLESVGYRSASIAWAGFDDISSYFVYRAYSLAGPWTKIKRTKGTSLTEDDMPFDVPVYYRIVPVENQSVSSEAICAVPGRFSADTFGAIMSTSGVSGQPYDVAVSDGYAYVAAGSSGLAIIDVSDLSAPGAPVFFDTAGTAHGVAVSGNTAYLADGSGGLVILDVSDPTNPYLLGSCSVGSSAYDVAVSGDYAYVADGATGLTPINVSDPANPTRGSSAACASSSAALNVALSGSYAYVAAEGKFGGLNIFSIESPSSPSRVGKIGDYALDIAVSGGYAYMARGGGSSFGGVYVYSVSDPAVPVLSGNYSIIGGVSNGVAVHGDTVYLADQASGLCVVDVSTPSSPTLTSSYSDMTYAFGVAVTTEGVFVADQGGSLVAINVSTPAAPIQVGAYDTPGQTKDIATDGRYAYVADGSDDLLVFDVSLPSDPNLLCTYTLEYQAVSGLKLAGRYLYAACDSMGLAVFDISSPASPALVGTCDTSGSAKRVDVVGDYAYVADVTDGLVVIDISDSASPVIVGSYNTSGDAFDVLVSGHYAYVADCVGGVAIIDVSYPDTPKLAATLDSSAYELGVAMVGDYLYALGSGTSVAIIDVSDPGMPSETGTLALGSTARGMAIIGGFGYVACDSGGLAVLDLSDASAPVLFGSCDTAGNAYGVAVAGSYAYIADLYGGVAAIDLRGQ